MRINLMIEGQEGVTWDQWLALALACEEHGLEGLFRSDHYAPISGPPERGSLDAWATLCALAARTERIRLGTLVSPVTFRHPSVLAKMVVATDHVSGGRVELGTGAGSRGRGLGAGGSGPVRASVLVDDGRCRGRGPRRGPASRGTCGGAQRSAPNGGGIRPPGRVGMDRRDRGRGRREASGSRGGRGRPRHDPAPRAR